MSVINKMLRDLEARRVTPVAASDAVRATAPQRKRGRLLSMLLLGGAAVAATAYGDWPSLLAAKASQTPVPLAVAQANEPTPRVDSAAPAAPETAAGPAAPGTAASAPTLPVGPARTRPSADANTSPASVRSAAAAPVAPPAPAALAGGLHPATVTPAAAPATASNASPPAAAATIDKRMAALPPAQRAQALYRQGLELAGSGHGRQAVERLQDALKLDPALVAARLHTASLLLEQGRGAEAETLARDGLALSADEPQLATLLARVLADRGDAIGALALLDRSERLGAEGFGLRAGLLSQQGDFRRALLDYEQAVRLQPGNSLWWLGLGVALEAEGRGQQARQVYARAQAIGVERSDLNSFIDQKLQQLD